MKLSEIMAEIDPYVDQEGIKKHLLLKLVKPEVEKLQAKVLSGELDLIPGTKIDNLIVERLLAALMEKLA